MEDVDTPRVVPGSAEDLTRDLEWLGLTWDGSVLFQSARHDAYAAALQRLEAMDRVYPCTCSRKEIRAASAPHAGEEGPRYPGTCRSGAAPKPGRSPSRRLRTDSPPIAHDDRRLGPIGHDVEATVGDFVLRRADGLWAYQLAVTVDDLEQGVTSVVRGEDLASSTSRQLLLRRLLAPDAPAIETLHAPLVRGADGRRLAKRFGSRSVESLRAEGTTAEAVVGILAHGLGLVERPEPLPATSLVPIWRSRLVGR